jgi:signal transduction histidine kinase
MNGAISGEVWMAQDITDRQRAQEELVVAKDAAENANRAKSLFLTTMSHELRTPLNTILGFAQLLRLEMEDDGMDRWDSDLDKIERAGQHLLGLINNILDLSKIDAGHMELMIESADVAELVRPRGHDSRTSGGENRNRISVSAMPATLMVDPLRVQQCLLNLIGNACKFTHEGEIAVEGVAESGWYRVRVRDSGIGIERQDIARLFGDITVESMPGHGSTFTLHLPAVPAQVEASSEHGIDPALVAVGG